MRSVQRTRPDGAAQYSCARQGGFASLASGLWRSSGLGRLAVLHRGRLGRGGLAGGLLRWPVKIILPIGFTLLALQGISELIKRIAFLRGQGPDPMGRLTDKSAEEELAEALRREAEAAAALQAR